MARCAFLLSTGDQGNRCSVIGRVAVDQLAHLKAANVLDLREGKERKRGGGRKGGRKDGREEGELGGRSVYVIMRAIELSPTA